jgi:cytochrome c553
MKLNLLRALIISASLVSLVQTAHAEDMEALKAEGKEIIKGFFQQLKGTLMTATKEGGPTHTIEVCNKQAPAIAADASVKSGWEVGRTSLRIRNPDNAPDEWESKVLNMFEDRKAKGEDPAEMAFAEIVENDGKKQFRMMKAIPLAPLCTNCHGNDIKPEIAGTIDKFYPEDKARGFNKGDIRGAFTLTKNL